MFLKNNVNFNKNNFVDLFDQSSLSSDGHTTQALKVWGLGNHKNNRKKYNSKYNSNSTHIDLFFELFGKKDFLGNLLEIGCGEGIDLRNSILKINNIKNIYAVDLGENIVDLSKDEELKKVKFIRCNCINLPFKNNVFDTIYSWGVFHHTTDFNKALNEAIRTLNKNGKLFFYTYKKQKNIVKYFGTIVEAFLMKILRKLNSKLARIVCYIISFQVLFLFSYPAQILKILNISSYNKIPYHWGWLPSDVYLSVADRLLSPINIRHSKHKMEKILKNLDIFSFQVIERNEGLFIKIIK